MEAMSGAGKEEEPETNTSEPRESSGSGGGRKKVGRGANVVTEANTGCSGSHSREEMKETVTSETEEGIVEQPVVIMMLK